jgi:D-inositol-3-phosphate glycosyltransferase
MNLLKKRKHIFRIRSTKNLGEKKDKKEARTYLKLDQSGKYLLFFGLIRDYKGLDLTLQSLANENIRGLKIQLIIAGEFYENPEKYQALIRELNLEKNIIIIDKYIATEDVKYYFSAADMVIQTYKTASQSGVSQMAFHFDRPILVTDVGGLSEVVIHNKVGYVCDKDPKNIADSIIDFYEKDRSDQFIKNIHEEKKKYSWEAFSESLISLYDDIHTIEK